MPPRKPFANNEIYHVIVRGVADVPIFKGEQDRYRAIFSLYEFNNNKPVSINKKRRKSKNEKRITSAEGEKRESLVEILAFCFMPNHIHLLLRQRQELGITKFMRKFGAGYAGYFNKKYNRKGYLFQGRFKAVHIQSDRQLRTVFAYIHLNPVSLIKQRFQGRNTKELQEVVKFLEKYKWSSYLDYLGKANFPSVTEREFLSEVMGGREKMKKFIVEWLEYKKSLGEEEGGLE